MNRLFLFYAVLLAVFAMYLAYLQMTWYSVAVLCMSFLAYAMLIGTDTIKKKKQ